MFTSKDYYAFSDENKSIDWFLDLDDNSWIHKIRKYFGGLSKEPIPMNIENQ